MHAAFEDRMTRGFCNSHRLSQFAAFFIGMETKISTVENFLSFKCGQTTSCFLILQAGIQRLKGFCVTSEEDQREGLFGVNDPAAGSPTATLLRLLLPLSDVVYLTSRISSRPLRSERFTGPLEIGRSDGRCVQRAGT